MLCLIERSPVGRLLNGINMSNSHSIHIHIHIHQLIFVRLILGSWIGFKSTTFKRQHHNHDSCSPFFKLKKNINIFPIEFMWVIQIENQKKY